MSSAQCSAAGLKRARDMPQVQSIRTEIARPISTFCQTVRIRVLRSLIGRSYLLCFLAIGSALLVFAAMPLTLHAQGRTLGGYFQSFLDRPPSEEEKKATPPNARDVSVAMVRVVERPVYLIGRDQSGRPPRLPRDLFYVRLEIVRDLTGSLGPGVQFDAFFGVPALPVRHKYPQTPSQRTRTYFVVSYVEDDGKRRLASFPIEQEDFESWEQSVARGGE